MKMNFFSQDSPLFGFRWFIVITLAITAFMTWHDLSGGRMFSFNQQQQWTQGGPGSHK